MWWQKTYNKAIITSNVFYQVWFHLHLLCDQIKSLSKPSSQPCLYVFLNWAKSFHQMCPFLSVSVCVCRSTWRKWCRPSGCRAWTRATWESRCCVCVFRSSSDCKLYLLCNLKFSQLNNLDVPSGSHVANTSASHSLGFCSHEPYWLFSNRIINQSSFSDLIQQF